MKCEEYQILITEAQSEPQPGPLPAAVADHLRACSVCPSETEGLAELMHGLKELPVSDPGDIFFARQLRNIESRIAAAQPQPLLHRWWVPTLAAAALVVFMIGYAVFLRGPQTDWRGEWSKALSWLAQDGTWEEESYDVEDLDQPQMDAFVRTMESRVNFDGRGNGGQDPDDWQDLDRQELDLLIERLQAGLKERPS